eukprot:GILI01009626.1.p1 GENE.GILI01009626.1~~GILI01009626.1.p1  ORF type:complete len:775 (+),score=137.14 GILI01009626.1:76-2325(+)
MHARQIAGIGGITPKARWGQTLTKVGDALYLFGGTTADGAATSDFFQYLPRYNSFEPIYIKGSVADEPQQRPDTILPPSARCHHTACDSQGRYLVVFGGSAERGTVLLNDVHAFDTMSQRWRHVGADGGRHEPSGRFGHSAVVVSNILYVFGGRSVKKNEGTSSSLVLTNDVHLFDLDKFAWKKRIHVAKLDDDSISTKVAPPKRFHHGACVIGQTMFIHGGEGAAGQFLSDTWALDTRTKDWRLVHTAADSVPRSRHALFGCGEALLALGGVTSTAPHQQVPLAVLAVMEVDSLSGVVKALPANQIQGWIPVSLGTANANAIPASKKSFGATVGNGFVYTFGGVTTNGQPCNDLTRCLAMDGVPVATQPLTALRSQMLRLQEDSSFADLYLEGHDDTEGARIACHRLVLQARAPKFLADILTCRKDTMPQSGHPVYNVSSNRGTKGLTVVFTASSLRLLLSYLYTASAPQADEGEVESADLRVLAEAAKIYELKSLSAFLVQPVATRSEAALLQELADTLGGLCESGTGATATLIFEDIDTHIESAQAGHPILLCAAAAYFRPLLRPVVLDGQATSLAKGVTAKRVEGVSGKRGIVVGKIPIPRLGVKYVMKFLYNRSLSVPPEDALMTMIAASALGLADLQAHCESIVAREEVNYDTACTYVTLAHHHNAPLLSELSLLTAALGFFEPSLHMQDSIQFTNLPEATRTTISAIAAQLQGKWTPPPDTATVQASPDTYQKRLQSSGLAQ